MAGAMSIGALFTPFVIPSNKIVKKTTSSISILS